MADNFSIRGKITIDAGPAAKALSEVSANFVKIATNARSSDAAVSKSAAGLKDAAAAAKTEAAAIATLAKAQGDLNKKYQEARLLSARATGANVATKNSKAVTQGQVAFLGAKTRGEDARTEETNARIVSRALRDQLLLREANEKAQRRLNAAQEAHFTQLASTRYALYDVARTATLVGAALLTIPVATLAVAVAWERDFARVQRTVDDGTVDIGKLRQSFVELASTIPEDWGALTEIGTLAGQLGVPADQIADFTGIVAKFSTTTAVSVDETATAFGRLNSLVPDVAGNYEGLADSVLNVGVNSVATEQQILKISTQLSFLGSQTTFTSKEIIGLSGALASVGVPPELSRGLVARVFGTIGRAIADGGSKLEKFGKIAGMSGKEFGAAWNEDAGSTFIRFMKGIQKQGNNAEAAIRGLGITSIRDVPVLIRLANAADQAGNAGGLITQTFRDAKDATGELARQYEIQSGTIAAKTQLIVNNFQALADAVGSKSLGLLGSVITGLTEKLQELVKFASTDFGGNLLGLGLLIAGIAGALSLMGAAAVTGIAGYMALILALKGVQTAGGGAAVSMGTLNTLLASTGPMGVKAAFGIRVLSAALKGLAAIGVVLVIPDVANALSDGLDAVRGFGKGYEESLERATYAADEFSSNSLQGVAAMDDFALAADRAFNFTQAMRNTKDLEGALSKMAESKNIKDLGPALKAALEEGEISLSQLKRIMPDFVASMGDAGIKVRELADGTLKFTTDSGEMINASGEVVDGLAAIEEAAQASEAAIKEASASLLGFNGAAMSNAEAQIKLQSALNAVRDAGKEAGVSLDGTNASSLTWKQSLIDTEKAAREASQAIIDNGGSAAYATTEYNKMREALIKEIAAKTGSEEKARVWADAILGTSDEASAAIQGYSDTVKAAPGTKDLVISTNAPVIQGVMNSLLQSVQALTNKTYSIKIDTSAIAKATGAARGVVGAAYGFSGGQFYEGGFTGIGGKYQPAGVVHKGEYVMPAYSVAALGTSYFDNIRLATQRGFSSGGSVSAVRQPTASAAARYSTVGASSTGFTTLDAQSIAAFVDALSKINLALYTTDRKIAESASRGSQETTQIGSM